MIEMIQATRDEALKRTRAFIPKAGVDYARSRNFDLGPHDRSNISMLSAFIRHRLIYEAELIEETLKHHSIEDAQKFIDEVIWRTYWKGYLEKHPEIWLSYKAKLQCLDSSARQSAQQLLDSGSGISCLDDWIQELLTTGYLHNHARMWFASIWIFHLGLAWELGAEFFERHLHDFDPASNTLSWRWVAGLHTPGKTYRATAENIERFTNQRYRAVDLAIDCQNTPAPSEEAIAKIGPQPDLDEGQQPISHGEMVKSALWIHQDDLGLQEQSLFRNVDRAFLCRTNHESIFLTHAIDDAQARLGAQGIKLEILHDLSELPHWLTKHDIQLIRFMRTFIGPARLQEKQLQKIARSQKFALERVESSYDRALLREASGGFFQFKKKAWPTVSRLAKG